MFNPVLKNSFTFLISFLTLFKIFFFQLLLVSLHSHPFSFFPVTFSSNSHLIYGLHQSVLGADCGNSAETPGRKRKVVGGFCSSTSTAPHRKDATANHCRELQDPEGCNPSLCVSKARLHEDGDHVII